MTGTMNKSEPDPTADAPDEELVAYLDGEVDETSAREIERRVATDPVTRTKIQSFKKTYDLLDYLPTPEPSADFATKTVTHILPLPSASNPSSLRDTSAYRPGIRSEEHTSELQSL